MSFIQTDKRDTIELLFAGGAFSPSDSTTYYMGHAFTPVTTATDIDFNLGYSAIIIGIQLTIRSNTTAGTNENITVQIRNTTQSTSSSIGTFQSNGGSASVIAPFTFTGLSIPLAATDYFCVQFDTPSWSINPVGTVWAVNLIILRT